MSDPRAALDAANAAALARRDAFRADVASGAAPRGGFETLKHRHPFIGFVEGRAAGVQFLMFHANDDVVAWHYFWLGDDSYEPELTRLWVEWAATAESVLDVGAYTGLMSILAALANPSCRIHAVEPVERTVERLRINLRTNGLLDRVTTHARAAANEFGVEMINYYRDENFLGTGSSVHDKGIHVFARRLVQTVNLDQYLGGQERFDLVKIDVEGFEVAVLDGMSNLLKRDRPKLLLEVWKENETDVFSRLQRLGYRYEQADTTTGRVRNYVCLPQAEV